MTKKNKSAIQRRLIPTYIFLIIVSFFSVFPLYWMISAAKELVPMQPGDVPVTYADTTALERDFGFKPCTSLRDGLRKFAEWYKKFYNV